MKKDIGKTKRGNRMTKLLCVVLCAVISFSNCSMEAIAAATKKAQLKSLNISWDLKPDKTVDFQAYQPGIGYWDIGTLTMSNYKVEKLKGKGRKKLTFTLLFNFNGQLSASQVDKINSSDSKYNYILAGYYYSLVDYDTGKCLECDNNKGVKVTASSKSGDEKFYYGSNGHKIAYPKYTKVRVKVIYPDVYKGLCIIAGGTTIKNLTVPANLDDFFDGKTKLGKANYISDTNNKICHAMRVK